MPSFKDKRHYPSFQVVSQLEEAGVSEEVNWLEWNLHGGEELAMAYIRIETREVI